MSEVEPAAVEGSIITNETSVDDSMRDGAVPPTMSALLLTAHNTPYKLVHDYPTPRIRSPTHVLVKVVMAGFCHSDDAIRSPANLSPLDVHRASLMPFVATHECAGYICKTGEDVGMFKA